MTGTPDNRKMGTGMTFLVGLGVGVVCYLLAESLTPKQVSNPGDQANIAQTR